MTRRRATSVPVADRPVVDAPRRTANGWRVVTGETFTPPGQATVFMGRGLVCTTWQGYRNGRRNNVVAMSDDTWSEQISNDAWAAEIRQMQLECERDYEGGDMPSVVMRDVSVSASLRGQGVVEPGHPVPQGAVGITLLAREVARLVADMRRYDHPTQEVQAEFARRYGGYRDAMARLRREFDEAEGSFEVAQAMLVHFMDQD